MPRFPTWSRLALALALASLLFLASASPLQETAAASSSLSFRFRSRKLKGPPLEHWPRMAAIALDKMIIRNAHQGRYAVFDMDNTSYRFDLEESLLPYLENKGVITRDTLDPSLHLIPFRDDPHGHRNETLYSYYLRLCDIDDAICYPFAAEVFSGIPLRDLKGYVDELLALNTTVPTSRWEEDAAVASGSRYVDVKVSPPRFFRGQIELYNRLMANGIEVYIVSASSEELVRMIASDPQYGYNVKPENVIGVTLAMRSPHPASSSSSSSSPQQPLLTTARKQIADGHYNMTANDNLVLTPFLWTPATWKTGKWSAILAYIDMWKKPVLVAGDTPSSDGPMLFHGVDVTRGGIHLWINKKDKDQHDIDAMKDSFARAQQAERLPVTANKNWVTVKPDEIL